MQTGAPMQMGGSPIRMGALVQPGLAPLPQQRRRYSLELR